MLRAAIVIACLFGAHLVAAGVALFLGELARDVWPAAARSSVLLWSLIMAVAIACSLAFLQGAVAFLEGALRRDCRRSHPYTRSQP